MQFADVLERGSPKEWKRKVSNWQMHVPAGRAGRAEMFGLLIKYSNLRSCFSRRVRHYSNATS